MSESTAMLLAATVGLPMALLALAVVHHARVISRMPAADEGWEPEEGDLTDDLPAMFTLPIDAPAPMPDPAVADLQRTVSELQSQLARQRDALTGLLSEQARAAARASAPRLSAPAVSVDNEAQAIEAADLGSAVRDLAAEGLSERAIARRLHVGLEEVRLLSRRRELAS